MANIGEQKGGPIAAPTFATIDLATSADRPAIASLFLAGIKGNERNGLAWAIENSISWGYLSGVAPQELLIQMHQDESQLLKRVNKRPIVTELEMIQEGLIANVDQTVKRKFKNLRILTHERATRESDIVKVTDDRYRWGRVKVWMHINVTRRTNNQIVLLGAGRRTLLRERTELYRGNTLTTVQRQDLAQVVGKTSLASRNLPTDSPNPRPVEVAGRADAPAPYTALDVVVEILEKYLGYKAGRGGNRPCVNWTFTPLLPISCPPKTSRSARFSIAPIARRKWRSSRTPTPPNARFAPPRLSRIPASIAISSPMA